MMGNRIPTTVNARNWTMQEMSVHAEQLYYLLQTISENFLKMEDAQRFALIEMAWNHSSDINAWFGTNENNDG
ncbi:hypothetical protein M8305_07520 [Enterobacter roggenkampii]|uniref:hypothetical protein n=1 Tax=Enterobacter cloacae complex TaxID=354276 RepID=UPI00202247FB|nr:MULTISPECIES: hypothetical protein [Enterobacter cloacae complex]MCL8137652.1 hypothetical protein [Enterobacter roggenkampii]MCM8149281.1 hypothetical protein [Enterobacter roggenkampii]MDA4842842.1 hypothetical protein [Enterobacter hormaechei]